MISASQIVIMEATKIIFHPTTLKLPPQVVIYVKHYYQDDEREWVNIYRIQIGSIDGVITVYEYDHEVHLCVLKETCVKTFLSIDSAIAYISENVVKEAPREIYNTSVLNMFVSIEQHQIGECNAYDFESYGVIITTKEDWLNDESWETKINTLFVKVFAPNDCSWKEQMHNNFAILFDMAIREKKNPSMHLLSIEQ